MMNCLMFVIAQAEPAPADPAAAATGLLNNPMLVTMMLLFAMMYFMIIRPQNRKEKERRQMIQELKSGTKVIFGGGIMGTITNMKDDTFVVKVADNVKVEVLRDSVSRVIEKGEKVGEEKRS